MGKKKKPSSFICVSSIEEGRTVNKKKFCKCDFELYDNWGKVPIKDFLNKKIMIIDKDVGDFFEKL